jgi:hypothetical protein
MMVELGKVSSATKDGIGGFLEFSNNQCIQKRQSLTDSQCM